ncbi:MAG: hypothetical protein JXL20_02445 [Deltaproteobacteria bacterium]|nr:hypothetical protein [Deltaproteobacteria bacterium]
MVELQGHTDVDNDKKMVMITNLKILRINFPSLEPARAAQMDQLVRTFLPSFVSISLHRLVACVPKPESVPGVPLNNDPPVIFVSNVPAILLSLDGNPVVADVPKTNLAFVVNTAWPLFYDKPKASYYLLVGQQWMTAKGLEGPWSATVKLPSDMAKVAADPEWAALKKAIPPPSASKGVIPRVLYSNRPAEVILFDGNPAYAQIPGTQLLYATNTSSYLFLHTAANQYYYLTGGRWFRSNSLQGPWSFATMDLPVDFLQIPLSSPASVVRVSVPGTDEAMDAVLLAQVPTRMTVNPATAAASVEVIYGGEPRFEPISGTTLYYAANTQDKVIKVGDVYYLCLQGVWFLSTTPQGPWTVASSVPQVIYTIPPSSPVYNVTYVTQYTTSSGSVECSHTAGYMGAFIVGVGVGAIIANGSGYYYPPYIYRPPYGYPRYYPPPYTYGARVTHYNAATGAYGVSRTVYGPYGSSTRGAAYNPYTGTSARGAAVSTPYGSRSAAQAYNPYTGTYAATRQGSSPTAQWGSSVVSKGGKTAYTQHYTTAQGTVGSVKTSTGGKAVGVKTDSGITAAGKTSGGDLYATHDGNVYKNTGSGWQSYDNGSWNSVNTPAPTSASTQQKTKTQQQPTATAQGAGSANQAASQQRAQSAQPQAQARTQPYQQPTATAQGAGSANQAASQQRAQSAQQPASAGSYSPSGKAPSSQMQGLQKEAQNRQRGAQQSSSFAKSREGGKSGGGRGRRR